MSEYAVQYAISCVSRSGCGIDCEFVGLKGVVPSFFGFALWTFYSFSSFGILGIMSAVVAFTDLCGDHLHGVFRCFKFVLRVRLA